MEDAAGLRGKTVYIDRADVELEEGECFVQDLIGCTVRDADTGADYGQVYDCLLYTSHRGDRYV